jgi:uncharacterized protein
MKKIKLFIAALIATALFAGCTTLDEKQRAWIFQPSDRTWSGGLAAAEGMQEVWIPLNSPTSPTLPASTGAASKTAIAPLHQLHQLHGLWLASGKANAPVLLYLHGARYNVTGSAPRIRRMQELGFSVLAIDYRGFGKSSPGLPSEASAYEDARAAWDWLGKKYPQQPRYIFGHSLGGPIAIHLASEVTDESGTLVEGTFTSIADIVGASKWGWVPLSFLITQRFDAAKKVAKTGSPLLVVHGAEDQLIAPALGRKLFEAAAEPKMFVLVEGGSHHNTNLVGLPQYRDALAKLFALQ